MSITRLGAIGLSNGPSLGEQQLRFPTWKIENISYVPPGDIYSVEFL